MASPSNGMAWRGTAWRNMAWHGMAQHGMAWHGMVRHGATRHGHAMVRQGMAWRAMAQTQQALARHVAWPSTHCPGRRLTPIDCHCTALASCVASELALGKQRLAQVGHLHCNSARTTARGEGRSSRGSNARCCILPQLPCLAQACSSMLPTSSSSSHAHHTPAPRLLALPMATAHLRRQRRRCWRCSACRWQTAPSGSRRSRIGR